MADINLTGPVQGVLDTAASVEVYTRTNWSDSWTLEQYLFATDIVWSVSPTMPTATLEWRYSEAMAQPGATAFAAVNRKAIVGKYVRIRLFYDVGLAYDWYGIIAIEQDGATPTNAAGLQVFSCYGLEILLEWAQIGESWIWESPGGTPYHVGRPVDFNAGGDPNASAAWSGHTANPRLFGITRHDLHYWTSRTIVDYLLAFDTLRDYVNDNQPPFAAQSPTWSLADAGNVTPAWDTPTIRRGSASTTPRTVRDLLNEIYAFSRLLGWYVVPNGSNIEVRPFSYADAGVALPGTLGTFPANTNQKSIDGSADHTLANVTLKATQTAYRDQTIYRGALITSTATWEFDEDDELDRGWDHPGFTQRYNEAASLTPTYAGLGTDDERRKLNATARAAEDLRDVFARFVVAPLWDGTIKNGTVTVFPAEVLPNSDAVPTYDVELRVLPQLPFFGGVDYSGNKIDEDTVDDSASTGELLPPLVTWQLPEDTTRYTPIELNATLGGGASADPFVENHEWSASAIADGRGRGLRLTVDNAPRHVLAFADFSPLPIDRPLGENDYQEHMLATLTIEADFYCEGRYPADAALPSREVYVRRLRNIGREYRADYVTANTVLGTDAEGALVKVTAAGWVRDDREFLEALATIDHVYNGTTRNILHFETQNLHGELALGLMVTTWGPPAALSTVNTVISEMQATIPPPAEGTPEPIRLRVTTNGGQLDPLQFVGEGQ